MGASQKPNRTQTGIYAGDAIAREHETIIVGGGTTGLFTAFFLAKAGQSVTVLDRAMPWSEASGVNAGSLAVQNKLLAAVPYTLASLSLWQQLAQLLGGDVGFRNCGGFRVAFDAKEKDILFRAAEQQAELGMVYTPLVGNEVQAAACWISGGVVAATYCPQDSYSNPMVTGPVLLRACAALGVRIHPNVPVEAIELGHTPTVTTPQGRLSCRRVVVACGSWTSHLVATLGVRMPIDVDTNMLTVTEPASETVKGVLTDTMGRLTVKQVANGSFIIGGGWQGIGNPATGQKELDYESLLHNLRLAMRAVPALAGLSAVRSWAGFDPASPDMLPYFGRLLPGHQIFVSACARGGWTLGPLLGKMMMELIVHGDTSLPIDKFEPRRFHHG